MNDQERSKQQPSASRCPASPATVTTDVAERKLAEEALRQSRDELQMIYDEMVEGCIITDIETKRFVRANSSICRMLGYTEEELLAASLQDIHPPEEVTDDLQRFQQVAEGQRSINENRPVLRKDGGIFYADITGRRILYHGRPSVLALFRDVTERRQAQIALRESEEKYKTLVETSPDAVIVADLTGRATFVSRRLLEIHGADSVDELLGKTAFDFLAPEDHPRGNLYFKKTLEEGITRDIEYSFIRKDGTRYPAELSAAVVKDASAKPVAIISVLRDITDRKLAEQILRQSRDELQAIYDGMFEGLLILDFETKRLIRVNSSLCQMLGYTEEELLSMSVMDIHPEDEIPRLMQRLQARIAGRFRDDVDVPLLRKDGSIADVNIIGNPLVYHGRQCIAAFVRDISERKAAEEAIADSETKYRHLVETTDTGYLILDEQGRVVDVNAEYVRLTGRHTPAEILGRSVVEWTAPYDAERNAKEVEKCLQTGAVRELEVDYIGPDGKVIPVEINASVVNTKRGRRIVSLCRDITERKLAEETLQQQHRTLKHLLQSSDHERQTIAYEIHDGLAQQLAGAIMQFQTYSHQKKINPKLAAKAYDAGTTMLQQGHFEARRLITGVRPPILDEEGVVEAVAHLVHEQNRLKGPRIDYHSRVDFDRLAPTLENAIYRIAQEGLTNACRHSKSDKVRVSLVQREDRVRIEIRDWGIGFATRSVQQNRFGLVGIRQRVRLLGGKCSIRSKTGEGTCISVELPVVERE
jgi:PAS domain S-box-containing protein